MSKRKDAEFKGLMDELTEEILLLEGLLLERYPDTSAEVEFKVADRNEDRCYSIIRVSWERVTVAGVEGRRYLYVEKESDPGTLHRLPGASARVKVEASESFGLLLERLEYLCSERLDGIRAQIGYVRSITSSLSGTDTARSI